MFLSNGRASPTFPSSDGFPFIAPGQLHPLSSTFETGGPPFMKFVGHKHRSRSSSRLVSGRQVWRCGTAWMRSCVVGAANRRPELGAIDQRRLIVSAPQLGSSAGSCRSTVSFWSCDALSDRNQSLGFGPPGRHGSRKPNLQSPGSCSSRSDIRLST